jgi:hypothetical protein
MISVGRTSPRDSDDTGGDDVQHDIQGQPGEPAPRPGQEGHGAELFAPYDTGQAEELFCALLLMRFFYRLGQNDAEQFCLGINDRNTKQVVLFKKIA